MSDIAISVNNISKIYKLYDNPMDRLKESLGLTRQKKYKEHYALDHVSFQVHKGETVGIIGTEETVSGYHAHSIKNAGARADEEAMARNLYTILREFDDEGMTVMYSESFETAGMGQAIMNRLLKAAGHKIIKV